MPIDLSLIRVTRLLSYLKNPHLAYKSIHVAGTNGKGSIVAYLSSILTCSKIRNGRFTSPQMLQYNDSICINNKVYPQENFDALYCQILGLNKRTNTECTEFELLAVTAFTIFRIERVRVAVIEVGLGGRFDATNVLRPYTNLNSTFPTESGACEVSTAENEAITSNSFQDTTNVSSSSRLKDLNTQSYYSAHAEDPQCREIIKEILSCEPTIPMENAISEPASGGGVTVTAITKIAMDHEIFLGNTLEEIAREKAGIIKRNIPIVIDSSNDDSVLREVSLVAEENNSLLFAVLGDNFVPRNLLLVTPLLGSYQKNNLAVALTVWRILCQEYPNEFHQLDENTMLGIKLTQWHGRLQSIRFPHTSETILLDGAHNESAAIELGRYLKESRKSPGTIFIIAITHGKSPSKILRHIADAKTDTVVATTFTPPEQMPWVVPIQAVQLQEIAERYTKSTYAVKPGPIELVISQVLTLKKISNDRRRVVVCGSLYLCADVLRFVEQWKK